MISPLPGIKVLPQEVGGPASESHMFTTHKILVLNLILKLGGA